MAYEDGRGFVGGGETNWNTYNRDDPNDYWEGWNQSPMIGVGLMKGYGNTLRGIAEENQLTPDMLNSGLDRYISNYGYDQGMANHWGPQAMTRAMLQGIGMNDPTKAELYKKYNNPQSEAMQQGWSGDMIRGGQTIQDSPLGDDFEWLPGVLSIIGMGMGYAGMAGAAGGGAGAGVHEAGHVLGAEGYLAAGGDAAGGAGDVFGGGYGGYGPAEGVGGNTGYEGYGGINDNGYGDFNGYGGGGQGGGGIDVGGIGDTGGFGGVADTPNIAGAYGDASTIPGVTEGTPLNSTAIDPSSYGSWDVPGDVGGMEGGAQSPAPITDKSVNAGFSDNIRNGLKGISNMTKSPYYQVPKTMLDLYGQYQNQQAAKQAMEKYGQMSDPFGPQRARYQGLLSESYSNPDSLYKGPEYTSLRNMFEKRINARDAAAGRRSQYGARELEMADHFNAYLDNYRKGLQTASGAGIAPNTAGLQGIYQNSGNANKALLTSLANPALWSSLGF